MREVVKTYPEKHAVSVKGLEWSLWIRKVKTRDKRVMFVLKPLELHYSQTKHDFKYIGLKKPIWLKPSEVSQFIEALTELNKNHVELTSEVG